MPESDERGVAAAVIHGKKRNRLPATIVAEKWTDTNYPLAQNPYGQETQTRLRSAENAYGQKTRTRVQSRENLWW